LDVFARQPFARLLIGLLAQVQGIIPEKPTTAEALGKSNLLFQCRINSELTGNVHKLSILANADKIITETANVVIHKAPSPELISGVL